MCLRISSSYRILSPPLQRAFTRVTFGFCHVRESGGIQPPRQKDFTAQDTGSCSSLALNFGWRWFFTDSLGFIWQFLDLLFRQQQTALEGSISCSSQTCQCRIHPHSQAFPQRKFSVPSTFSMDNEADPGSQSSCLCKAGLSHHPRIALGGEDLRMALGQLHQPFCHPNLPAHPSHQGWDKGI